MKTYIYAKTTRGLALELRSQLVDKFIAAGLKPRYSDEFVEVEGEIHRIFVVPVTMGPFPIRGMVAEDVDASQVIQELEKMITSFEKLAKVSGKLEVESQPTPGAFKSTPPEAVKSPEASITPIPTSVADEAQKDPSTPQTANGTGPGVNG